MKKQFPKNLLKLFLLASVLVCAFILLPWSLNYLIFQLHCVFIILCILLPLFFVIGCAILNDQNEKFSGRFSYIKYYKWFPLFFYYDRKCYGCKFKDYEGLKKSVSPGDVLLRRYDNYLDGLILAQNSYFTHAAIYMGDGMVVQALGNGVKPQSLEDFSRCDDIAVLRFKYERIRNYEPVGPISVVMLNPEERHLVKDSPKISEYLLHHLHNGESPADSVLFEPQAEIEVQEIIKNAINESISPEVRRIQESVLYWYKKIDYQLRRLRSLKVMPMSKDKCIELVLKICNSFVGKEYDLLFSFSNTNKVSCVELAWYSYVFLFPLHQMKREPTRFFFFVKTKIILPDFFIDEKRDWFELIFSGNKDAGNNRAKLYAFANKSHLNFGKHLIFLLLAQLSLSFVVLGVIWIIKKLI